MNVKRLKRSLRRVVGPKALLDDPASIASYSYDSSLQTGAPDFVIFPQTTEHVAKAVRLLCDEGVPYIARGAGTNLSGGSVPVRGGAVIALARMKRIHSIEPENFCARVGPGLTNLALQDALAGRGFFFAPDPASQKVSTLGGNVAENSGGPRCLKYGVTTNHILGVELVTPDGEIIRLGGETLDGPDSGLLGLLIGSEGTLGIVTEIACRIMPLPESVSTMLAIFDSTEQAGRTVSDIIAAGILPATLEMMDNLVIRAVEQSLRAGYPTDAAAVLIIEVDGVREGLSETSAEIERICRNNEAREVRTARDERERAQLWAGRRGAFGAVARLFPNYAVSDGTVPRTRLPQALRRVAEIGRKYDLEIGNVFHAGDGNLHPLVFFDARDEEQLRRVHRASEEILEACVEAGGTITGEHGVGSEKIKAMPRYFGPDEIELMHGIKNALDPAGLCNPGKILPDPERAAATQNASGSRPDVPAGKEEFSPSTLDELSAIVRRLADDGDSFAPVGARTLFPHLPMRRAPKTLIHMTEMRSIIEHDAANLTATVQAGLTLGDLKKSLREAGQFLPLDAPASATVGGAAASALAGPRRHAYGTVGDLALGVVFVGADGKVLRAGGKTVKNVAGYDFGKLLIGSWGTLGIIAEITFRLLPLPRACGAVVAGFDEPRRAHAATTKIFRAKLDPALATLLNKRAAIRMAEASGITMPTRRHALVLGAEGVASSVERRLDEFERICKTHGSEISGRISGGEYEALMEGLSGLYQTGGAARPSLSARISAPCGETPEIYEMLDELESENGEGPQLAAHLGSGSLYSRLFFAGQEDICGIAGKMADLLMRRFPRSNLTIFGVSGDAASRVPFITGNLTSSAWRESIKSCLDPEDLLNPGMPKW